MANAPGGAVSTAWWSSTDEDYSFVRGHVETDGPEGEWKCYIQKDDRYFRTKCPVGGWDKDYAEKGRHYLAGDNEWDDLKDWPSDWDQTMKDAMIKYRSDWKAWRDEYDPSEMKAGYKSLREDGTGEYADCAKCKKPVNQADYNTAFDKLHTLHDKILKSAEAVEATWKKTKPLTTNMLGPTKDLAGLDQTAGRKPGILDVGTGWGSIYHKNPTGIGTLTKDWDTLYHYTEGTEGSLATLWPGTIVSINALENSAMTETFFMRLEPSAGGYLSTAAVFTGDNETTTAGTVDPYLPREFATNGEGGGASLIGQDGQFTFLYPSLPVKMVASNGPDGYLTLTDSQKRNQIASQMFGAYDASVGYAGLLKRIKENIDDEQLNVQWDLFIAPFSQYQDALKEWLSTAADIDCFVRAEKCMLVEVANRKSEYADLAEEYDVDVNAESLRLKALTGLAAAREVDLAAIGTENVPPFFREQCFLLSEMPYFSAYKKRILEADMERKALPYVANSATGPTENNNACLQMDGDPFGFMNRLTQYPGYANIANMKTSEIANLQPLIRLFKILVDKDGKEQQLEIPFDSYFTKNDLELFRNKASRGVGVGIKDFTFSYEADNPFAVKKSIKAKLTMFANNFTELLKIRYVATDAGPEEFKYVDLALKTGVTKSFSVGSLDPSQADVVVANLDKLKFRLKAVVGWNYRTAWGTPKSDEYNLNTLSPKVRTALYNSFITLSLTPTVHEFDIDDQGRVKFVINYLAYVEDFYDQPAFNIFPDTKLENPEALESYEFRADIEMYTERARVYRDIKTQTFAATCKPDQMSTLKEELANDVEVYRQESLTGLIKYLIDQQKIRYLILEDDHVFKFRRHGPSWEGINDVLDASPAGTGGIRVYNPDEGAAAATAISGEVAAQLKISFPTSTDDPEQNKLNEKKRMRKLAALGATGADSDSQTLTFFYVSDLVDAVLVSQSEKYGPDGLRSHIKDLEGKTYHDISFKESNKVAREVIQTKIERFKAMEEQLKKLRILLGPIELVHQANFDSIFVSLGDVPISVKYFIEWLSKKMSDREETYYSLPKFLNDLVNDLLRNILNDPLCFSNQAKQKTRMNQAAVTSYKVADERIGSGNYDEITRDILLLRQSKDSPNASRVNSGEYGRDPNSRDFSLPALSVSADRDNPIQEDGIENEMSWLIYYSGRTMPVDRMRGIESEDAARGIFHYTIGRDRGITKTIKLKKTDTTGLKELRFEQDGYDGLKQLREVFDVDISTYANVHAYPGSYIFVDPKGFSPNSMVGNDVFDLTQIGIGGYHMIVRSEHSFGPGYADSTIQAKWVASTHATVTEGPEGGAPGEQLGKEQYCFDAGNRQKNRQKETKKGQKAETDAALDAAMGDGSWTSHIPLYDDIANYLDDGE